MFRVRILSYLGKMFDFGLTRLDFHHNSLKYGQFQALKIPIFSETRSKLLSCVCFKYLEPSIAIWSGENDNSKPGLATLGAKRMVFVTLAHI